MNVILEGPDGSGKTTLAHILTQHVPLVYTPSRGPEQYPGEIIERVYRYLRMDNCLFDRHPIVSQSIYGRFRQNATQIPQDLVNLLYRQKPLIIYCHGRAGAHELKEFDTAEHVTMIHRYDDNIRAAYEEWANRHAKLRYQVGDEVDPIIQAVKEFCRVK